MDVLNLPDLESSIVNSYIQKNTIKLYKSNNVPSILREKIDTDLTKNINIKLKN